MFLKSLPNCWYVKVITCNRNGTPDIIACIDGRFFAFEVKTPNGRVAPIQDAQISAITLAGGSAHVVRSVDDVKKILL